MDLPREKYLEFCGRLGIIAAGFRKGSRTKQPWQIVQMRNEARRLIDQLPSYAADRWKSRMPELLTH